MIFIFQIDSEFFQIYFPADLRCSQMKILYIYKSKI